MTKEQYKRAAEIMDKISDIEDNIRIVRETRSKGNLRMLVARRIDISDNCVLLNDLLPVPAETFIDMYLITADRIIVELEKEFENL